jgi:hypothetical protein
MERPRFLDQIHDRYIAGRAEFECRVGKIKKRLSKMKSMVCQSIFLKDIEQPPCNHDK